MFLLFVRPNSTIFSNPNNFFIPITEEEINQLYHHWFQFLLKNMRIYIHVFLFIDDEQDEQVMLNSLKRLYMKYTLHNLLKFLEMLGPLLSSINLNRHDKL